MKSIILPLLATAALSLPLFGQENDLESRPVHLAVKPSAEVAAEGAKQSPETLARLDSWFTDAKFGVFIHFGVYSALEGKRAGFSQDGDSLTVTLPKKPVNEYDAVVKLTL